MSKSEELFNRAMKILPGGVNSPVRAFKSVSGTPPFMVSASGCILTDADGNEYIDYIGSWGPMILGHTHPQVTNALIEMAKKGTSFGTPSPVEVDIAEEIVKRVHRGHHERHTSCQGGDRTKCDYKIRRRIPRSCR